MTGLYFLLTILIESPVHALVLRRHGLVRVLAACVLMNGVTHPLASFAYIELGWSYWLVEGLVVAVEAALIQLTWREALWKSVVLSIVANGLSAGAGMLWMAWG